MREVSLETLPNVNIRDPSHDKNLSIMSVTELINQNVFKWNDKVGKNLFGVVVERPWFNFATILEDEPASVSQEEQSSSFLGGGHTPSSYRQKPPISLRPPPPYLIPILPTELFPKLLHEAELAFLLWTEYKFLVLIQFRESETTLPAFKMLKTLPLSFSRSFLNQGVQIFNKKSLHISSRIMGVDREVLAAGKAGLNLFKKFND